MSYTDLRDFAAEFESSDDSGRTIRVEKLGGGTVGEEYAGIWRYVITDHDGNEIARGQDFTTSMPHTHSWVATCLSEWCDSVGESFAVFNTANNDWHSIPASEPWTRQDAEGCMEMDIAENEDLDGLLAVRLYAFDR